jgi:hypothetical protein
MAATVTSKVLLSLSALLQNSAGLASAQANIDSVGVNVSLASGVGATQADRVYSERDKSISVSTDIDLSGSLVDALGAAVVFARVRALLVIADANNAGNVIVGGDANAVLLGFGAAASTLAVRPGGILFLYAPDATGHVVTAGTGDILQFAPSAGTVVFSYAVLGCSA